MTARGTEVVDGAVLRRVPTATLVKAAIVAACDAPQEARNGTGLQDAGRYASVS